MIPVNSLTTFCFLFKNVYFTFQNIITTALVFPCSGGSLMSQHMIKAWIYDFFKPRPFSKRSQAPQITRRGEEEGSFFSLDSWMSVCRKIASGVLPKAAAQVPCTVVLLMWVSRLTQSTDQCFSFPITTLLNKLIKILLSVYSHYIPFVYIMGCCICGKYKEKTSKCKM